MRQAIDTARNERDMAVSYTLLVADPGFAGFKTNSSSVPYGKYTPERISRLQGYMFTDKNGKLDVYYQIRAVNANGIKSQLSEAKRFENEGDSVQ